MATISRFFGIRISMYPDGDPVPQFYAEYGEHAVVVATLEPVAGHLPRRAMALVLDWAMLHLSELWENWRRAQRDEPLLPIAPLDQEDGAVADRF